MKKTMLVMAMAVALAMSTVAGALATSHTADAEIISPTAGEVVYQDTLNLEADAHRTDGTISWAVRSSEGPDCPNPAGTLLLERKLGVYSADGNFSETLDVSGVPAGKYCFAFQADADASHSAVRVVQHFYIVDDYILVDASIDDALDTYDPDTGKPDYSVSGTIGLLDAGDLMGTVELRYHNSKITCYADLASGSYGFPPYGGASDAVRLRMTSIDYTCDDGHSGTFADVQFLEASVQWPNGATAVDTDGVVNGARDRDEPYDLVGTFDNSRDWVPLDRGSVVFNLG